MQDIIFLWQNLRAGVSIDDIDNADTMDKLWLYRFFNIHAITSRLLKGFWNLYLPHIGLQDQFSKNYKEYT